MKKSQSGIKELVSTTLLIFAVSSKATDNHNCGGVFSGQRYLISSPNYPENYPNDQNCVYDLRGNFSLEKCNQVYELEFLDFDIRPSENCEKDFLRIGESSLYCGNTMGTRKFKEKQNGLRIVFHSDKENNGRGFKILVNVLPCLGSEIDPAINRSHTVTVPEVKAPPHAEKNSLVKAVFQNRLGVTNERPTTQILESVPTLHHSYTSQVSYPVFRPDVNFPVEDNVQPGRGDQSPVKLEAADKNENNVFSTVVSKWPVNSLELPIYEQHNFHDTNCRYFNENQNLAGGQVPVAANLGHSAINQRPHVTSYLYLPPEDTDEVPLKFKSSDFTNFTSYASNVNRPDLIRLNQNQNVQVHRESAVLPTISSNVEQVTEPPTTVLLPDLRNPRPFQSGTAAFLKNQNSVPVSQNRFQINQPIGINCSARNFNCDGNPSFPETNVEFNTDGIINTNFNTQGGTDFDVNTNFEFDRNPGVNNFDVNQNPSIFKNFNVNPGISTPFPAEYPNPNFGVSEIHPTAANFYPDSNYDFSFGVTPNSYPSANFYYPNVGSGSGLFGTIATNFNNLNTECCNTVYASRRFLITSPGFPSIIHSSNPYECRYTIQKYSPNVCRLRFNFKFFYHGSDDPFCARGYLELDGRRICGCKTGLTVTSAFPNYVIKTLGLKYLGYPRTKFNGFVIEVVQETCWDYLRSKKDVIDSDFRISSLRQNQNDTNSHVTTEKDAVGHVDTRGYRNRRDSTKKEEREGILKNNEEFFDIERDSEKDALPIRKTKRNLHGYSYPVPAFGLSADGRHTFLNTGSPRASQSLFWSSCQTMVFLNWAIAAKEVYLKNAQCSRIGSSTGGMIPIIPIFPGGGSWYDPPVGSCENINVIEGTVTSPQYPYNYPNNIKRCYRFFKAPGCCQLELAFLDFDLETSTGCFKDYVSFSGQYRRYCGTSLTGSRTIFDMSRVNIADMYFVSDSSGAGRGFRAGFAQLPCPGQDRQDTQNGEQVVLSEGGNKTCGGDIRNMYFSLSSPQISSGHAEYCVYNVYRINEGKSALVLNFRNFFIPCGTSYLEINDQRYCGNWTGKEIRKSFEAPFIRIVYFASIGQLQSSFCATGIVLTGPDSNPRAISLSGSQRPECILEPRGLKGLEIAPVLEPRSPKNVSCSYIFSKKEGYCVLRLEFIEFDLMDSLGNCETGYLAIRSRNYCGKFLEGKILDLPFGSANTEEIPYFVNNNVDFVNWRFSYKYLPCKDFVE